MQRVIHFEIYTRDPEAVCPFYQDVRLEVQKV